MLTESEYVEQQISLGRRVHSHAGVWWEETYPFYCKPAFVHRAFDPGRARPRLRHSLLGFSHQVVTPAKANRTVGFMVLDGDDLREFSLARLKGVKRNQVRKGMKCCRVGLIEDLERDLEQIRQINISQSIRQEARAGAEAPASRYIDEADQWRAQVRREFSLRGREWWGAWAGDVLAAYLVTYQVESVRTIERMKSHTDQMRLCPVDALYFCVLEAAAKELSCERVLNGRPQHESLNHYKQQFLFRPVEYPYYSRYAALVERAKKWTGS